mmetsp:Transcript_16953/g.39139  ORF Transcript_16953/g.39139 Transcript_16953/m.39139 type:complete len:434 (-) Transcript_16953:220-1521(-)
MKSAAYNLEDEEKCLKSYLERTTAIHSDRHHDGPVEAEKADEDTIDLHSGDSGFIGRRVYCCKTSRSLYCPECCKVLVPKEFWPRRFIRRQCIDEEDQSFPFNSIDIILGVKERRTSSTGIQLMCISNMVAEASESVIKDSTSDHEQDLRHSEIEEKKSQTLSGIAKDQPLDGTNGGKWWNNIKLYDLNRGDVIPQYSTTRNTERVSGKKEDALDFSVNKDGDTDGTYVLFPQEGKSVPISTVATRIKRLVVLDIKWTRSYNVQLFSADHHKIMVSRPSEAGGGKTYNPLAPLKDLPFVHLEHPPQNSHFWRWHNRGVGMLSTIEAVYFAAREVSVALERLRSIGEDQNGDDNSEHRHEHEHSHEGWDYDPSFVDILWLFALQRSIIQERSLQEGRPVAFSEEAKAQARALRKQHRTENTRGDSFGSSIRLGE